MGKMNRFLRFSNFLKFSPTLGRISVRAIFSQKLETNVSKSALLDRTIENRLRNLRPEVDLGYGPAVDKIDHAFEESIIKCRTIEEIRRLIRRDFRFMEARHVAHVFKSIQNILRFSDVNDCDPKYELLGSKEFEILANRTLRITRHLESKEALEILLDLDFLGISPDTVLSQALMQMVRYGINEYSIDDLYRLVNYLKNHDPEKCKHSLMKALLLGLPYAVKHRIAYKEIDFYHPKTLMKCLEMIAYFGIDVYGDKDTVEKCLHHLHKQLSRLGLKDWIRILSFIYKLDIRDQEQLKIIQKIIRNCIQNISSQDHTALSLLPPNFYVDVLMKMKMNQIYYDKILFDIIANQAYERKEEFGIHKLFLVLQQNYNFKYVNHKMLMFFADLIESNDSNLWQSPVSVISLFRFFTLPSNYEEIHSNFTKLAQIIIGSRKFKEETAQIKMNHFYFTKCCLMLKAKLDSNLIFDWFSEYFKKSLEVCESQSNRHIFLKTMVIIHQGLFVNRLIDNMNQRHEDYIRGKIQPYLDEYSILMQNGMMQKSPIHDQLFHLISRQIGRDNIVENHITKSGLSIDFMAQLEQNRKPLAILLLTERNYCRDPNILDGETRFKIESVKNSGMKPVLIDSLVFCRLGDLDRETMVKNQLSFALKDCENEF